MSNLVKVIDKDLEIKEWRNKRVVTVYKVVKNTRDFSHGMN